MPRKKIPGITPLPDGRYQVRVTVGKNRDGKPIRRKRICESHAEARQAIRDLQDEYAITQSVHAEPKTVSQFIDQWLRDYVAPYCKKNTLASYKQQTRLHIKPRIGSVNLSDLTPTRINSFLSEMRADDVPVATQKYVLRVCSQIFKRACQLELLSKNPVDLIPRPAHKPAKIFPFTFEEANEILNASNGMPLGVIPFLGICQGMRIGEILGLQWDDINFENRTLSVERTVIYGAGTGGAHIDRPKTESSIRTIQLADNVIKQLNERRKIAVIEGQAASPWVLTNSRGNFVCYQTWQREEWKTLLQQLGLKHRGFHHTRHTYATIALGANVPITVVSQVLGHANPKITLEIYAHALPDQQQLAVNAMNQQFG